MDPIFSEGLDPFNLSAESGGNSVIIEKLRNALNSKGHKGSPKKSPSGPPHKPGQLRYEILSTLPKDVEAYRVDYFQIPLKGGGNFPFFIVKGFIPKEALDDFVTWRADFEKHFGITVFPQLRDVSKTLRKELSELVGSSRLISRESIKSLRRMINQDHPVLEPSQRNLHFEDRRDLNWLSIDGPEVRNREDILCAKRERDGIRFCVGFVDQSIYLPPDSQIEKLGRDQINALPTKNHAPTVVGQCLRGEKVNFVEGENRFAWVVEVFLGDNGEIKESNPYRASVINKKAYTNGEFFRNADQRTKYLLVEAIDRLPRGNEGVLAKKMGSGGTSEELIAHAMVYAKSIIANFLHDKGVPTLYRNHQLPKRKNIIRLVEAYRDRGIPAEFDDFTDSLRLAALCSCLTTKDSLPLLSDTLSLIYFPSTVSFHAEGHEGVGSSKYCEVKPHKNYSGMYNGYALGAACYGEPLPSFVLNKESREAFESRMNLAIQTKDLESYKYIRIKTLLELFERSDSQRGTITKDGEIEFNTGRFSKLKNLGFRLKVANGEKVREGDIYRFYVLGFDPNTNEIIFRKDEHEQPKDKRARYLQRAKRFRGNRSRFKQ